MSELTSTRIREAADRLGLTHLPDHGAALVTRAETDQLGYWDFLDLVLGEDVDLREQRRFRNALKLSGLPPHKTFAEFDYAFQSDLEPRRIKGLATLEFTSTPDPTSPSWGPPESARYISRSPWRSRHARPGTPTTSPPWTTSSGS